MRKQLKRTALAVLASFALMGCSAGEGPSAQEPPSAADQETVVGSTVSEGAESPVSNETAAGPSSAELSAGLASSGATSSGQTSQAAPERTVSAEELAAASEVTGRYLRTKNDGHMIIVEGEGPVSLSVACSEQMFETLKNGDKVSALMGAIEETYPAMSTVYKIERLEEGSEADIDQDTLIFLTELGWLLPEREEDRMLYLDGTVLHSAGRSVKASCSVPDGQICSTVAFNDTPSEEGQSNFGSLGSDYSLLDKGAAAVWIGGKNTLFLADGTVEYMGRFYQASQLSEETLGWLRHYNSLPEEDQLKISMVPPELIEPGSRREDICVETEAH